MADLISDPEEREKARDLYLEDYDHNWDICRGIKLRCRERCPKPPATPTPTPNGTPSAPDAGPLDPPDEIEYR